jgi:hypothetical protein
MVPQSHLEQPTVSQLIKKFPAFCDARKYTTVYTRAILCHMNPTNVNLQI